jgi:hypothetical protein
MASATLPSINEVSPLPGYCLRVRIENRPIPIIVSFAELISQGGVFSGLRDKGVFENVRVGARRRTIYWPKPCDSDGDPIIEIDAESLIPKKSWWRRGFAR